MRVPAHLVVERGAAADQFDDLRAGFNEVQTNLVFAESHPLGPGNSSTHRKGIYRRIQEDLDPLFLWYPPTGNPHPRRRYIQYPAQATLQFNPVIPDLRAAPAGNFVAAV